MSYREESERAAAEIAQEYYRDEAPTKGAPSAWPAVPEDDESDFPEELPYTYIELLLPGGEGTYLAILTKIPVAGGPGRKYRAEHLAVDDPA